MRLASVSASLQHRSERDDVAIHRAVRSVAEATAQQSAAHLPGFDLGSEFAVTVNGAGEFVTGGPFGDNGLSGKKLVMDFYGPRVPIGGGALSGKDLWKADRAGALIARGLALSVVDAVPAAEATVTLGIKPGDRVFELLRVDGPNGRPIERAALAARSQLAISDARPFWPEPRSLVDVARHGHFTDLLAR